MLTDAEEKTRIGKPLKQKLKFESYLQYQFDQTKTVTLDFEKCIYCKTQKEACQKQITLQRAPRNFVAVIDHSEYSKNIEIAFPTKDLQIQDKFYDLSAVLNRD